MKSFKINNYLSLKLEDNATQIYINDKLFRHCRFLMLNIPIKEIYKLDTVDSIDEASEKLNWNIDGQEGVEYNIDPESEFWGHCSNLQAWYENDYDTRLLHSNLAFPLLKKLTEVGDLLAKKVFKEEIALRFESRYPVVISYIIRTGLLNYLDQVEREYLLERNFLSILKDREKIFEDTDSNLEGFNCLIELIEGTKLVNIYLTQLFEIIDNFPNRDKYFAFFKIMKSIKGTQINDNNVILLLQYIDNLVDYNENAIMDLIELTKGTKFLNENLPKILISMKKISIERRYETLSLLIYLLKKKKLTENSFEFILENVDCLPEEERWEVLSDLIESIKETEILKKHIPTILKSIQKLSIKSRNNIFSHLINSIKGSETFNNNYLLIKSQFSTFIEDLDSLSNDDIGKFDSFFELFTSIKGTQIFNENFTIIETRYVDLLKNIALLPNTTQYDEFPSFIILAKKTDLMKKHKSLILKTFSQLPESKCLVGWFKKVTYSKIVEAVKDTELENETTYQEWLTDFSSAQ